MLWVRRDSALMQAGLRFLTPRKAASDYSQSGSMVMRALPERRPRRTSLYGTVRSILVILALVLMRPGKPQQSIAACRLK